MATATVSHVMVANTTALASETNTNFTNLLTFLNTDVIHVDGSKAMTGELTLSGAPTANNSAARKLYVDDSVAAAVPPGVIVPYAGTTAPTGYLLCYGQAVNRTTYAALFAITSTTYGVGDGSTTFNVPDLRGRVGVGLDNMGGSDAGRLNLANTLGTTAGAQTHTLIASELAAHTHTEYSSISSNTYTASHASGDNAFLQTGYVIRQTGSTGSNAAHNNMQPSILLNYIIKT